MLDTIFSSFSIFVSHFTFLIKSFLENTKITLGKTFYRSVWTANIVPQKNRHDRTECNSQGITFQNFTI